MLKKGIILSVLAILASVACAQEVTVAVAEVAAPAPAAPAVSVEMFTINNIWVLIAAFLVFIMHPGFALLEAGLTRAKNCVNILSKNLLTVAIGMIAYLIIGFGLMYPGTADGGNWIIPGFLGFAGFGLPPLGSADAMGILYNGGKFTYYTDFLFQAMFAATCATIVSGAMAGRTKLLSYLLFTVFYPALVYTVIGSWVWGGGWLLGLGFHDLAGSSMVHSVGGWAALVGAIMVGPRIGKFVGGKAKAIPAHNMPIATLGVFLLWFGWFGFNGGSVLSADPIPVAFVCTTTALAGAAGVIASMITSWIVQKKPDLSMMLNGALAGLVAITAGADVVTINGSVAIGVIAGVVVVFAVYFFDKIKIDDPVGALSVHLVCGVLGTFLTGVFGTAENLTVGTQLIGIAAIGAASLIGAFIIFLVIKLTVGLRVTDHEQHIGLDIGEHGSEAYNGFQIFSTQ